MVPASPRTMIWRWLPAGSRCQLEGCRALLRRRAERQDAQCEGRVTVRGTHACAGMRGTWCEGPTRVWDAFDCGTRSLWCVRVMTHVALSKSRMGATYSVELALLNANRIL